MLKRTVTLFIGFISAFPFAASACPDSLWTLQACIDYALEHNVEIRQQKLAEMICEEDLSESRWAFSPSISASTGMTGSTGRVLDPTTYQFIETKYTANTNSSISGNMTLFEGGRKLFAFRKSKLGLNAALLDTEALRNNLKMNVIAAFLDVLCAEEQKQCAESTVSKLEEQMKRSQNMYEAGAITESDILQLKSQLFAARNDILAACNAYDLAKLSLCDLLEIEDYKSFSICSQDDIYACVIPEFDIEKAIEAVPEFRKAVLNREIMAKDQQIAKSSLWPSLSISAGYGSNFSDAQRKMIQNPDGTLTYEAYPFLQQYADNASAYASISLNIPILTGMRTNINIRRTNIQAQNAEYVVVTVRKEVRKKIIQAQIDFNTASEKYISAQEQLRYAEAAEMQISDKYNLGVVDYSSWNAALYELAIARYNLSEARCTLIMKNEILKVYADL